MSWLRNLIVAVVAAFIAANSLAYTPVYAAITHNALAARSSAIDDLNRVAVEAVTLPNAGVRAADD